MRPTYILLILLAVLSGVDSFLYLFHLRQQESWSHRGEIMEIAVAGLGVTDLCISTEARYTRHPAVSDPLAPFMDHPGAIEHFPTGSFWSPPSRNGGGVKPSH